MVLLILLFEIVAYTLMVPVIYGFILNFHDVVTDGEAGLYATFWPFYIICCIIYLIFVSLFNLGKFMGNVAGFWKN